MLLDKVEISDLVELCYNPSTTKHEFKFYLKQFIRGSDTNNAQLGLLLVDVSGTARLDLLHCLLEEYWTRNVRINNGDLFSTFELMLSGLNVLVPPSPDFLNLETRNYDYQYREIEPIVNFLAEQLLMSENINIIEKWNFFALVCETGKLSTVERYFHILQLDNTTIVDSLNADDVLDLYQTMIIMFHHQVAKFIYEHFKAKLISSKPNIKQLLTDICLRVKDSQKHCGVYCDHYLTVKHLLDDWDKNEIPSIIGDRVLFFEMITIVAESKCLTLVRWLIFRFYEKFSFDIERAKTLIRVTMDVEILKSLLKIFNTWQLDVSKCLRENNEEMFLRFIANNDLLAAQFLYNYRSNTSFPVDLSCSDYECFYKAVSIGSLELTRWLYLTITGKSIVNDLTNMLEKNLSRPSRINDTSRTFNHLDFHANYEELFHLACQSRNLLLAKWFWNTCLVAAHPVNLYVQEGYIFKNVYERGLFEIAEWLTSLTPYFILELKNGNNYSDNAYYEYKIDLPPKPDNESISFEIFAKSHKIEKHSSYTNSNRSCPICNNLDSDSCSPIINMPCNHSLCFECLHQYYLESEHPLKCFLCRKRFSFVKCTYSVRLAN